MVISEVSAPDRGPFQSLSALQSAHVRLRDVAEAAGGDTGEGLPIKMMMEFREGVQRSGAFIQSERERDLAQRILDYWTATVLGSPDAPAIPAASSLLYPYNPSPDATIGGMTAQPTAALPQPDRETERLTLRIGALARQWRSSGKPAGYLLSGDALAEAMKVSSKDETIAELVQASVANSVASEKRKRQLRRIAFSVLSVLILLAVGLLIKVYIDYTQIAKAMSIFREQSAQTNQLFTNYRRQQELLNETLTVVRDAADTGKIEREALPPQVADAIAQ